MKSKVFSPALFGVSFVRLYAAYRCTEGLFGHDWSKVTLGTIGYVQSGKACSNNGNRKKCTGGHSGEHMNFGPPPEHLMDLWSYSKLGLNDKTEAGCLQNMYLQWRA